MKKIIATLVFFFLFSGVLIAQGKQLPEDSAGVFKFDEETWDFSKCSLNLLDSLWFHFDEVDDESLTHLFHFTNTGQKAVVITNCTGNDSTTIVSWSKYPILPGKTGVIKVFYTPNHSGNFNEAITIISNSKSPIKNIYIKGSASSPVIIYHPDRRLPF